LPDAAADSGIEILPLSSSDLASFHRFPNLSHRDPFDRLLIWQAIQNQLTLISKGHAFIDYRQYGFKLFW